MTLIIDPAKTELKALRNAVQWRDKQVLEVGCGEGRLTLRLAELGAAKIMAVDPDKQSIRNAREALPKNLSKRIQYNVAQAEHLKFKSNQFDLVVFSWVL